MSSAARALEQRTTSTALRQHYERAPIVEPIIEIPVDRGGEGNPRSIEDAFRDASGRGYDEHVGLVRGSADVGVDATGGNHVTAMAGDDPHGYAFRDRARAIAFQARLDGLSFHKQYPYT